MIAIDARLNAYRTGGIATYTRSLLQGLARLLPPDALVVLDHRKASAPTNARFRSHRLWTPPHHWLEGIALGVELLPLRLDVLHSPDFIPPRLGAKRYVITVHDLTFLHYPETLTLDSRRYYNDQIRWAVHKADHILTDSNASKQDLVDLLGVPTSKITVAYAAADQRFCPLERSRVRARLQALGLPVDYLLHVGTWEPRKNLDRLAQAYRHVLDALPDAPPLVLVGKPGWKFDAVRARIDALCLPPDKLLWRSNITDDDLPAVYNGCLFTITPSLYEGFGLPALEGMACGKPALVSHRSSLPEVVGDVGLLFNPDDPDDIAAAILHALTDPHWRAQQQVAALAQATRFSWDACAQQALAAYRSVTTTPII